MILNNSDNYFVYICTMINKITAYSLIFLANIVLLAHAVLPHHHHKQQVCIEQTHCAGDAISHSHSTTGHNHQHDETNSEACILKQAVIIPTSQARLLNNCDNCSDNHNHDFFIPSYFGLETLQPITVTVSTVSEFTFSSYITSSLGLRAPPIV